MKTADPHTVQRTLEARARALARPQEESRAPRAMLGVVEFELARERYALAVSWVREVCRLKDLTPLPGAPAHMLGITHLRGRILSVVDIKPLFDLPRKGLGDLDKLIVLHGEATEFGVLADRIIGMRELDAGSLQPTMPTLIGVRRDYLLGITADRLVVLDAEKLLRDTRLAGGGERSHGFEAGG